MKETNIFELIQAIEKMNNENIMRFTKAFDYPIGISPILVLAALHYEGPQKQKELAERVGYTKGAMTHIAEKLVSLGLAGRVYDEADRRTIRLEITAAGEQALAKAQQIGQEVFMDAFEVLNEEEIEQYLKLQKKLLQGMKDRKLQQNKK